VLQALLSERRSKEEVLAQAYVDHLTGLPNRLALERSIEDSLNRRRRTDANSLNEVGVIFVDVDQFKLVNDTFGHSSGDVILTAVAERLRARCRPSDSVGRIGGDEFVVFLDGVAGMEEALELAQTLKRELGEAIWVDGSELYISASMGVALADSESSGSAELVIRDADTAMYVAKARGRDTIVSFDGEMRSNAARRLALQTDLRHAIARGELSLVFQPIVSTASGAVQGVEALLRWNHPQLGSIPPSIFVPLAEESGQISEIGNWVLERALSEFATWKLQGGLPAGFSMAINLSALQLLDETLAYRVGQLLDRHGIDGAEVCLELTESVIMDNIARATTILAQLREREIHIAIDDFGSGYSSLAYLGRLPVNKLKIDKAFIDHLEHGDSPDETLIAAIVAMADSLGMSTVAEGVETPLQARRVRELGCDSIQGYLFSRPVRGQALLEVILRLQRTSAQSYVDATSV
jgi:diguanylate cyclase (GGDEF)-like protein